MLDITFTGDFCFRRERTHGEMSSETLFDADILQVLRQSHYAVFNLEGPITSRPTRKQKGVPLRNVPDSVQILKALHCNVLNLANNHIMDHGLAGLRDTIRVAQSNRWWFLGAGENIQTASAPVILRQADVAVGLISVCHKEGPVAGDQTAGVFCDLLEDRIRTGIRHLKNQCDWVVLIYHGGEEYSHVPMPPRRKRILGYLADGADLVISHHAHAVQGYEIVDGKYAFYGLGNFLFDLEFAPAIEGTEESLLLSLSFGKQSFSLCRLFKFQDRQTGVVRRMPANRRFCQVSPESYAADWSAEAHRILKRRLAVPWPKKVRRCGGLMTWLWHENRRPILLGGLKSVIRNPFGFRFCSGAPKRAARQPGERR